MYNPILFLYISSIAMQFTNEIMKGNATKENDQNDEGYLDQLHKLVISEKPCISDSVKNLVSLIIAKHQVI